MIGLVVLQANVPVARLSHRTALAAVLADQQLLLHLGLCAWSETPIMVVRLIGGEHCTIHDRLARTNLTTMLRHVIICGCAAGRLKRGSVVGGGRLVHAWGLLDHSNRLSVLIS